MECKRINAIEVWNSYEVEEQEKEYLVEDKSNRYCVCYCVRFRDPLTKERILARGRRNDRWEWTPDWIFNDWII